MQKERLVLMSTLTTGPVGGVKPTTGSLGDPNASGQIKVVANHPEYHTKWCVYQTSPSGVTRRPALEPLQSEIPLVNPVTIDTEGRWYVLLEADPGVSFYPGSNPVGVDVHKNVKTKIKVTY